MICISSNFSHIEIPDGVEYSIHFISYSFEDGENDYENGDLIITTPTNRYTFSEVPNCFDACASINRYILKERQQGKTCICVDLAQIAPAVDMAELDINRIW